MKADCQLCRFAAGQPSDGFVTLFGKDSCPNEVLVEKGDCLVVLDVAPVVPGHILVVTRLHERSFAAHWRAAEQAVHQLTEAVVKALRETTGKSAIVCEHGLGPAATGQAGCVEHAHLHVIPMSRTIQPLFANAGIDFRPVEDLRYVLECAPDQQYLYLRDADGRRYAAIHHRFPSQLVRRLVAQRQREPFWAWRDYVDFQEKVGTKRRILDGLKMYQGLGEHAVFRQRKTAP